MTKPVVGVLVLALVVGGVAFAVGKATVSDAKSPSQHVQGADTANPTKAPALASTVAIPALRKPKPAATPTGSTSSPSTPAAPSGPTTPAPGPSGGGGGGGGGGGSGGTSQTPGAGEF